MKASQYIQLAIANNRQVTVPEINIEKMHIQYVIDESGFDLPRDQLEAYMLSVYAATGLSWSPGENLLYLALNDEGQIETKLTYIGGLELALQSGEIQAYQAWAIREGDSIRVFNDRMPLVSLVGLSPKRGELRGGIASALLPSGEYVSFEIDQIELESVAENGSEVWQSIYVDEMVKKQALWRLLNHVAITAFDGFYNTLMAHCEALRPIRKIEAPTKKTKFMAAGVVETSACRFDALFD